MIKASYGDMKRDSDAITKAADDYKINVEKLYQEVDQLSDAWKGDDNQEYVTTVNGYKKDIESLGLAVEGYAKFLAKAASVLNTTQDEVKNLAGRL